MARPTLLLLFLALSGCDDAPDRPKMAMHLQVRAGLVAEITNQNTFDWTACDISINSENYTVVRAIKAGETAVIPLAEFADKRGLRFAPLEQKLMNAMVNCTTPFGILVDGGSF